MSLVRQKFHEQCETGINKQINSELCSTYVYFSMASYFKGSNVVLPGVHELFKEASDVRRERATKLITYQNKRGGTVVFQDLKAPERSTWTSAKEAMSIVHDLEKRALAGFFELCELATTHNDAHFDDFLKKELLPGQLQSCFDARDYTAVLNKN